MNGFTSENANTPSTGLRIFGAWEIIVVLGVAHLALLTSPKGYGGRGQRIQRNGYRQANGFAQGSSNGDEGFARRKGERRFSARSSVEFFGRNFDVISGRKGPKRIVQELFWSRINEVVYLTNRSVCVLRGW